MSVCALLTTYDLNDPNVSSASSHQVQLLVPESTAEEACSRESRYETNGRKGIGWVFKKIATVTAKRSHVEGLKEVVLISGSSTNAHSLLNDL